MDRRLGGRGRAAGAARRAGAADHGGGMALAVNPHPSVSGASDGVRPGACAENAQFQLIDTSGSNPVVLVVEDEPDWHEALAAILEDASYQVMCAANGAEALRLLERYQGRCDVILLDLMMPVMNGWDFRSNQLRNPRLADIPVLLMSAGARLPAAHDDLQAAGYLNKPVSAADVVEQL